MTPTQIKLVQDSFEQVVPIADQAAAMFYGRLFDIDPELRSLFKTDLSEQGRKLMTMIRTAVNGLNNLDAIVPAVQALGRRHVEYGVVDADYDSVGEALLWTLEQGLGEAFTSEVKEAWTQTYNLLAGAMKDAAAQVAAA